jgi:PadR family transcriptional regulator PadR
MNADLLRGHLDGLLLAVLADAPGHGYELGQRLTRRSAGELGVPEGSLYPALHRRVYSLTPAGRRAVQRSRHEWRVFSAAVDRVLGAGA